MSLKTISIAILISVVSVTQMQAQFLKKYFDEIELIGGIASTSYFGDVGGQDYDITGVQAIFDHLDIDLWQTRMAIITGVRLSRKKNFSFSVQLSPMILSGNDQRSKYAKQGRNYAFTTSLVELSLQAEY